MPVIELMASSGLGSLLGMRHALEPDHLAAVTTHVEPGLPMIEGDHHQLSQVFTSFYYSFRKERAVTRKIFMPQDLLTCKQVWLRVDIPKNLQHLYSGPYEVIDRISDMKTSILKVGDDKKSISV